MKCSFCGGEVGSQSVKCPYCNNDNPAGIAFQKEVYDRIERNRLLRLFLLRQKKPELVQKMLTRAIIIATIANVLLFILLFVMVALGERFDIIPKEKEGHALAFNDEFLSGGDYYCGVFSLDMYKFMDAVEEGKMPDEFCLRSVVSDGYDVMRNLEKLDEETRYDMQTMLDAFFRGYIGLSEEEMKFLQPDEEGEYSYSIDAEVEDDAILAIKEKLGDSVQ